MKLVLRFLLLWALFDPALAAGEAEYVGWIVGVVDGDTVDLLTQGKEKIRIRLSGIDAPEKKQAFGAAAKSALSDLAFNRAAIVRAEKRDRYGRLIGKVVVAGTDVSLQMVRTGFAWHFKKYEREQSPEDRRLYAEAEIQARAQHKGLWSDKDPVAPWDFRAARKSQSTVGAAHSFLSFGSSSLYKLSISWV